MAAVSQKVLNYLGGVSREIDQQKRPGYVKDLRNTYPDITFGMTKRPGFNFVKELGTEAQYANAYWFFFRYSDDESYIGMITGLTIRMWNFSDGTDVTFGTGQDTAVTYFTMPTGETARNNFSVLQKQDYALILNKQITVDFDSTTASGSITATVNSMSDLPATSGIADGAIYEVKGIATGSGSYFIQWSTTTSTWTEVVEPGKKTTFDGDKMPRVLTRTSLNNFTLTSYGWGVRPSGTPDNGAEPSFLNAKVNEIFFYNNRLGFLSKDNVIFSQPIKEGEGFNFFRVSALTASEADPIDLTASSLRPVELFGVVPLTQGLMLHSQREQFVITGGRDGIITPATASIKSVSRFEMNNVIDPVLLGTSIIFTSLAPSYTRVFSMDTQGSNDNPQFIDIGKVVSEWIPSGLDKMSSNTQNSFIYLYGPGSSKVYFYRDYKVGDQTINQAWFKWDFSGPVQAMFTEQDRVWVVVTNNGKTNLLRGDLNPTPTTATVITTDGRITVNPCIDYLANIDHTSSSVISYDSNTRLTTIVFPFTHINVTEWKPIAIQVADPSNTAAAGAFWELTHTTGNTFTVKADLTAADLKPYIRVGYTYPYEIDLPKTYFRADGIADSTASLTISRMKFIMGKTGAVAFEVKPRGSNDFNEVKDIEQSNWYLLDSAPIDDERMFPLPIHQRNDNFEVRITSDSPYPVSLVSMMWEGQYSPRYYARS